jgi:hypothetical protein
MAMVDLLSKCVRVVFSFSINNHRFFTPARTHARTHAFAALTRTGIFSPSS